MNNYRSSMTGLVAALIAPALALCVGPVSAAPKTATPTVAENGVYVWVDGLYQQVKLPAYSLGIHNTAGAAPFVDLRTAQTFTPRLDGGGVRAAIGYAIPDTMTRIEVGGSYVDASATQSQTTSPGPFATALLLTGAGVNQGLNCSTIGFACSNASVLGSDYRAWQFNGKAETDWRYGSVTVTPSLAVFGGNTRADQTLSGSFTQFNAGVVTNTAAYSANTKLEWRDLGARAGLHLNVSIAPALTIGLGGSVGAAARRISFSGNDVSSSTNPGFFIAGSSALSLSDSKAVLLANAEANASYRLTPTMSLRGFAGLNYDGDVPGIGAPSFAGSILAPTSRGAASIVYASQTSFYGGGGMVVKFGGGR